MKTKLIQTKDYLLLIDEEDEIKKGGYAYQINYEKTNIQVIKIESDSQERIANDKNGSFTKYKIIAYYPLTKEAKELDLPLLPNPFEDDINKIADKWFLINNYNKEDLIHSHTISNCITNKNLFIEGYKAAQSKQFSLKDMKDILEEGLNWFGGGRDKEIRDSETWFNHYIQSLSTQKLPKEFIPEYDLMNEGYNKPEDYPYQECKVLKTITNSEGKEELVGTYK